MDLVKQLNHIFYPETVAIIGASDRPEKAGFLCVKSLLDAGFRGRIYPVNPALSELLGLRVYPSVGAIPADIDLAIIAIPAQFALTVMEECVAKGIKGVIMITSGFKELGTGVGVNLQEKIRDIANEGGVKIVGPNCLGVINPYANLNATFNPVLSFALPGSVAVVGQSGGVCTYITNTLTENNVGVSKVVSMGNRCNLDFDELVEYLAQDEKTKVIVLYIEGLENPRRLMSVARQVVRRKPIVAYKAGRTEELNQASLSHTGALAGKYQLYTAAFNQAGIIAVDDITEVIDVAKALALRSPSAGDRVAVVTGPAGGGIIAASKCGELGLKLAELSPATRQKLRKIIPPMNPVDNPVDLAWASREYNTCRRAVQAVMEDDNVDMIAAVGVDLTIHLSFIRALRDMSSSYHKPLTFTCMNHLEFKESAEIVELEKSGVPVYPFPERAVTALAALYKYGRILKTLE